MITLDRRTVDRVGLVTADALEGVLLKPLRHPSSSRSLHLLLLSFQSHQGPLEVREGHFVFSCVFLLNRGDGVS